MNAVTASAKPPTEISFILLNSSLKKVQSIGTKITAKRALRDLNLEPDKKVQV